MGGGLGDKYNQSFKYNDDMSPWEGGKPPGKGDPKRALLPTPNHHQNTNQLSNNLMASVNQLFQMGGTEKQLLNIVQAVVASVRLRFIVAQLWLLELSCFLDI